MSVHLLTPKKKHNLRQNSLRIVYMPWKIKQGNKNAERQNENWTEMRQTKTAS